MYQYPEVTLTYFVTLRTSNWYSHYSSLFGENLTEKQSWMQCSNNLLVDLLITLKDSKAALRAILGTHDTDINKTRIRKPLPLLDQFVGGNVSTEVDTLIRLVATRLRFDYGYDLGNSSLTYSSLVIIILTYLSRRCVFLSIMRGYTRDCIYIDRPCICNCQQGYCK